MVSRAVLVENQQECYIIMTNNVARLILREKVDFARQQHDHSCFVLFGTRQRGTANVNNASSSANANKLFVCGPLLF